MSVWIKFIDWGRITINRLVVNIDFRVHVVLKRLFSSKIRVELYGQPH